MEKILVTTDLSDNSKAGLRFAIKLAEYRKSELIFLHVHYVLRATTWSDTNYSYYIEENEKNLLEDLTSLVASIYKSMKIKPRTYRCDVHHVYGVADAIEQYAIKNQCDYICIATKGAGNVQKFFGTNTGKLIMTSSVPIICVPSGYRTRPINKILYASDMAEYQQELEKVVAFAKPMKAAVELLHMSYSFKWLNEIMVEKELKKKFGYAIDLHYKSRDIEDTLLTDLWKAVTKSKPGILVMFTRQDRSLLERFFSGSITKNLSYITNIPMLIFKKES